MSCQGVATEKQASILFIASTREVKPTAMMLGMAMKSRNDSSSRYSTMNRSGRRSVQRDSITANRLLEESIGSFTTFLISRSPMKHDTHSDIATWMPNGYH